MRIRVQIEKSDANQWERQPIPLSEILVRQSPKSRVDCGNLLLNSQAVPHSIKPEKQTKDEPAAN
jgi:hypothetical protein